VVAACVLAAGAFAVDVRAEGRRAPVVDIDALWRVLHRADRFVDPVSEQGQKARGLYFNGPMQKHLGAKRIIATLRAAGMDAAVLDLKDGEGRVTYDTKLALVEPQEQIFVPDMPAMVAELRAAGIYTIARVVCFSDPKLPRTRPDLAVMDGRPHRVGEVWGNEWTNRNTWLDPYNVKNHELVQGLAEEAEAMGFDEVQLDYVRFPVDGATKFAVFPGKDGRRRTEVILSLLRRLDEALTIPLGVDVFGVTAFRRGDPDGLGQLPEEWARYVEVFSPMLYINGMHTLANPGSDRKAGGLIYTAMKNLSRRLGHGPVLRPFMQAFPQGAGNFGADFIAEQVLAARAGGADGFLFWHPASNYGTVREGMTGPARGQTPFPIDERLAWRKQTWADRMSAAARARYLGPIPARPVPGGP
jgi:hypothetical protein